MAFLWDAGVPVAPVVNPRACRERAARGARLLEPIEHPVAGTVRIPGFPATWDTRTQPWHSRPAPLLGEHNVEVLGELGVDGEQLAALAADGVIGDRPVS